MFNQIVGATLFATGWVVLGYLFGWIFATRKANKRFRDDSRRIGTLRVDSSDPDRKEPYMFLEIDRGVGVDNISKMDTILLDVDTTSYLDM